MKDLKNNIETFNVKIFFHHEKLGFLVKDLNFMSQEETREKFFWILPCNSNPLVDANIQKGNIIEFKGEKYEYRTSEGFLKYSVKSILNIKCIQKHTKTSPEHFQTELLKSFACSVCIHENHCSKSNCINTSWRDNFVDSIKGTIPSENFVENGFSNIICPDACSKYSECQGNYKTCQNKDFRAEIIEEINLWMELQNDYMLKNHNCFKTVTDMDFIKENYLNAGKNPPPYPCTFCKELKICDGSCLHQIYKEELTQMFEEHIKITNALTEKYNKKLENN